MSTKHLVRFPVFAIAAATMTGLAVLSLTARVRAESGAQRTVVYKVNGAFAEASWFDSSNPDDLITGFTRLDTTGAVGQPYVFSYVFTDRLGTFINFGTGPIPAASVRIMGASVDSGQMQASVNVDTCQLDPSVFRTEGPCGTIHLNWNQFPGAIFTRQGTTSEVLYLAAINFVKLQGTAQECTATAQGAVIGQTLSGWANSQASIGFNREVNLTITLPH